MNNKFSKKARKYYREQTGKLAKSKYGFEILRLARNRDVLGIILILENIILIVLFFYIIIPLFK
jgi:hypothetical protein